MGELEETSELRLDFTKLEKVGGQVAASRAAGAAPDPGVIPVAVQNADTREVILVAYTNEHAMRESFAKRKLILWSTSRNKLWFKGETTALPRRHLPHEEQGRRAAQLLLPQDQPRHPEAGVCGSLSEVLIAIERRKEKEKENEHPDWFPLCH